MTAVGWTERLRTGLWKDNPGLVQLLGLCPLLAVTSTFVNGLGLGIATLLVLTFSGFEAGEKLIFTIDVDAEPARVVAEVGINITGQNLLTDGGRGLLLMDLAVPRDDERARALREGIASLHNSHEEDAPTTFVGETVLESS